MDANRPRVSVRRVPGGTPGAVLEQVLEAAGFWQVIKATRRAADRSGTEFRIVVKPDLDVYNLAFASGTDVDLVQHLASLLCQRGFDSITVLDARNSDDSWLLNREPLVVADLAGYDFADTSYTMAGSEQPVSAALAWAEGDFRINFAKNRTHEAYVYALCAHNLLGVSSAEDADLDAAGRCLNVLRQCPPHFNLIDCFVSCHGAAGERAPRMHPTCAFIASPDTLLADLAGASKMGLDPFLSPINAKILRARGLPEDYLIDGDLSVYPMWQNVHPLVADSARRRNAAHGLGRVAASWFQTVDRQNFPFREFYSDRINSFVAPLLERSGEDARAQWLVVVLNHLIAGVGNAIHAQHTVFAKGKLQRQRKPLEVDLSHYAADAYTDLPQYLAPFERLLQDAPSIANSVGLRRYDDAVLFRGNYQFPIAYDEFVQRVSIERSIQYMNDYIGGSQVMVAADSDGRVTMQAERNLYLQQPNWMVLFGGEVIDVEKIELIEYSNDSRTIYWRTVSSPNDSAQCDDGRVSFMRGADGCAHMEIFTHQKFTLPLFFHVAHIDMFPGFRDPIIERGYQTYFDGTVANMHAVFEGREYRVGHDEQRIHPFTQNGLGDVATYLATGLATMSELLRHKDDYASAGEWFAARSWTGTTRAAPVHDTDGFRHFGATPNGSRYDRRSNEFSDYFSQLEEVVTDTPGFFAGLATAIQRDFDAFADTVAQDEKS